MSTAYIAAGDIKDILSDTAHILLFREDQEDRNVCFLVFLIFDNCWGLRIFHIKKLSVVLLTGGDKSQLTCIFLRLLRGGVFSTTITSSVVFPQH